jgi:hypothetical protein
MMVYVDDAAILWRGKRRYHMTADTLDELHRAAAEAGINRCWFHRGAAHPHYDVTDVQRDAAVSLGAKEVSQRELVLIAVRLRKLAPRGQKTATNASGLEDATL